MEGDASTGVELSCGASQTSHMARMEQAAGLAPLLSNTPPAIRSMIVCVVN
jgi:hypothetical protein